MTDRISLIRVQTFASLRFLLAAGDSLTLLFSWRQETCCPPSRLGDFGTEDREASSECGGGGGGGERGAGDTAESGGMMPRAYASAASAGGGRWALGEAFGFRGLNMLYLEG